MTSTRAFLIGVLIGCLLSGTAWYVRVVNERLDRLERYVSAISESMFQQR